MFKKQKGTFSVKMKQMIYMYDIYIYIYTSIKNKYIYINIYKIDDVQNEAHSHQVWRQLGIIFHKF